MNTGVSNGSSSIQTGMVLLLCLIFLLALTLVGLSASSDTILQHRLAGNLQETERAKQSALLTLSWAEQWILSLDDAPPETCDMPCDGLYLHQTGGLPAHPESENLSWWLAQGHEAGINPINGVRLATLSSDSADLPVWIIELVKTIPPMAEGNPDPQVWYRILARGSGWSENTVSVIESTVVRSWPTVENNETPGPDVPLSCSRFGMPAKCGRYAWRELR